MDSLVVGDYLITVLVLGFGLVVGVGILISWYRNR